jgi:hypothetical protein
MVMSVVTAVIRPASGGSAAGQSHAAASASPVVSSLHATISAAQKTAPASAAAAIGVDLMVTSDAR